MSIAGAAGTPSPDLTGSKPRTHALKWLDGILVRNLETTLHLSAMGPAAPGPILREGRYSDMTRDRED
jgi:hypothetical protein